MKAPTEKIARNVRELYLRKNINLSEKLPFDILSSKKDIELSKIFSPEETKQYLNMTRKSEKGKDILDFSDDFNFTRDNKDVKQIRYGQKKVIDGIKEHLGKHSKVLSIGIGNGATAAEYSNGLSVTGIDLHNDYLSVAKKLIHGLQTNVFDLNSGLDFPFKTGEFDCAEITMVAHHIADLAQLLKETARCIRKGGHLFYTGICDKGKIEDGMVFERIHKHPAFHGIEYFRSNDNIKMNVEIHFKIDEYVRIGPGLLFIHGIRR